MYIIYCVKYNISYKKVHFGNVFVHQVEVTVFYPNQLGKLGEINHLLILNSNFQFSVDLKKKMNHNQNHKKSKFLLQKITNSCIVAMTYRTELFLIDLSKKVFILCESSWRMLCCFLLCNTLEIFCFNKTIHNGLKNPINVQFLDTKPKCL